MFPWSGWYGDPIENTPPQLVGGVENVIMQSLAPACGAVAVFITDIVSVPSFVTVGFSKTPVSKSSNMSGEAVDVMVGVVVAVPVNVGVCVYVAVFVGVPVPVRVGVTVTLGEYVAVFVGDKYKVSVTVGVPVGVPVYVGVHVRVYVGVGE